MNHARKMFLVSPHQMTAFSAQTIRQTAEEDLDAKMRAVLDDASLNSYEKIKRYDALLRRYLTLARQEEGEMTKSQKHEEEEANHSFKQKRSDDEEELDATGRETLQSLPVRDRPSALFVIRKLAAEGSGGGWSDNGEFIYRGRVVKGSHLLDLLKHLTSSFKRPHNTPVGWNQFLNLLTDLNVPSSMIHNKHAREQYQRLKSGPVERNDSDGGSSSEKRKMKRKIVMSPRWIDFTP